MKMMVSTNTPSQKRTSRSPVASSRRAARRLNELSAVRRASCAIRRMNKPKMIMLDEPTAGINPTLINGIINRLIVINQEHGITLMVIEHNMRVVMNLAQTVMCLAHGELLASGEAADIRNDARVIDAYLGAS